MNRWKAISQSVSHGVSIFERRSQRQRGSDDTKAETWSVSSCKRWRVSLMVTSCLALMESQNINWKEQTNRRKGKNEQQQPLMSVPKRQCHFDIFKILSQNNLGSCWKNFHCELQQTQCNSPHPLSIEHWTANCKRLQPFRAKLLSFTTDPQSRSTFNNFLCSFSS